MRIQFSRILCVIVLSLVLAPAHTQELSGGIEPITTVEGITEYRLDNGLRVLLFPDQSTATITVNVTYLVGSVHESYGETGMAHLLEHMLFKGTPNHPDILSEIQDRGARFNGTTAWDRTNYFETFDATDDNLEWALEFEADRMVNSNVAQADLDSEMTVVRNEFEASENNPIGVLFQNVMSAAYRWHGYGNTPIGSRSDIENVPIERLRAFYREHYQPDNAVLVVAGRIDEARTLELIAEHFGAIPRPDRLLEETYTEEPVQDGEREVAVRRVGDIQILMAGYHSSDGTHEDFVPLQIAAGVLSDEPSGRLYRALVEEGLAAQVGTQELQMRDPGMIIFLALVRADGSIDRAREVMLEVIHGLAENPITAEEVQRVKNRALSQLEQLMNDSQAVALQLSNWAAVGDWRMLFLDRDRVRAVTAEDAQRTALKYFKPSNRTIGMFLPEPVPDRTEIPDAPDLAALLAGYTGDEGRAQGEAFDPSPANIEARTTRRRLPGGVKLVMLPKETRGDVVNAIIRLNIGNLESLTGRVEAGGLTAELLMRGTESKTRQDIRDELDARQSRLSVGGGEDSVVAVMRSTREHLAAVIRLAIEVLREPAFPESELDVVRNQALAAIESQRSEPQAIVGNAFTRHYQQRYGRGDPRYAPTFDEQIEMLSQIRVEDLRAFHEDFFGASAAEVVVVGDFDAIEIEGLIADELDGWESPLVYEEIETPAPDPPIPAVVERFETPDKENAFLMAGQTIAMSDTHDDYAAMLIGNYLLGTGPGSRLFDRVRGTEGLSYGIGSLFRAQAAVDGARFMVSAIAAPQNIAQVEASVRDEIATVLDEGYLGTELELAKQGWSQSRQVARSEDAQLAQRLLSLEHEGRTMEWDAMLEEKIQAIGPTEVRDAMRRHLDLDEMSFMQGGDFAGLEE
jgi:zinc protease